MKFMRSSQVEDLEKMAYPKLGSAKIDGFRIQLNSDRPLTKSLSPFPNAYIDQQLTGILLGTGVPMLDGEITCGLPWEKGILQRTSSGVTKRAGEPVFRVSIFDAQHTTHLFEDRLGRAQQVCEELRDVRVRFLKHTLLRDLQDVLDFEQSKLAMGYEGIMLRDPKGRYKEGKSTNREGGLLKLKRFKDTESRVVGYYEEQENTNASKTNAAGKSKRTSHKAGKVGKNRLGGLILEDGARVGGGFTEQQRIELWKIREQLKGKLAKYSKQVVGEKDKPRHPNFKEFLDFRPEWDV